MVTHLEEPTLVSNTSEIPSSPIPVPFVDAPPSGSPSVLRSRTQGSKKRRTLILNNEDEYDEDTVPLASLRKNPSASASKTSSRKKPRMNRPLNLHQDLPLEQELPNIRPPSLQAHNHP